MNITVQPDPFPPHLGFFIHVEGGMAPYTFEPGPAPPNPPGVVVLVLADGNSAHVSVQGDCPPGTPVTVTVTDSSSPAQTAEATSVAR